jgi:hypothetical protein
VAEASIDIHQQLRLSENSVRQKSFNVFIFAGSYADTDVAWEGGKITASSPSYHLGAVRRCRRFLSLRLMLH